MGNGVMQFILEILWDLSRTKYLVVLPHEEEALVTLLVAFVVCGSAAVFLAHAFDAYQAG
jgi:hypothetical protein